MELVDTIEEMLSTDYRERFKAEYHQLEVRYKKLEKMLIQYEAGTLEFETACNMETLKGQLEGMWHYLFYMKVRAEAEEIDV